ncbi:MAG TPA: TetR/AcrR family transcriptional regulator [Longimicrobiales bacterium]
MASSNRRERHREQLRRRILTAAREVAVREGWHAVTIRKIASRVEYSAPAIYEYFDSKEALLVELAREGFRLLAAELRAAATAVQRPEARLLALANAYWDFAWKHPELYQVMHGLGGVPFGPGTSSLEAVEVVTTTRGFVEEVLRASGAVGADVDVATNLLLANLHGLISLAMAGRIPGDRQRGVALVKRIVGDFLAAWWLTKGR